ncbi:hypothetical protein SKAU_G00188470 [Synaphobranchus kaupii]|uniref:Uncharacterized protein n=1 Tax=Synaphobranchus kaupii TaxID=118154 RepID=A0A9Q1FDJ9_SYNKA|nr:hypothetical protein SKAU_G00188470 [Synaphobranchus kaupii]
MNLAGPSDNSRRAAAAPGPFSQKSSARVFQPAIWILSGLLRTVVALLVVASHSGSGSSERLESIFFGAAVTNEAVPFRSRPTRRKPSRIKRELNVGSDHSGLRFESAAVAAVM